jgi:hypothetical protein
MRLVLVEVLCGGIRVLLLIWQGSLTPNAESLAALLIGKSGSSNEQYEDSDKNGQN